MRISCTEKTSNEEVMAGTKNSYSEPSEKDNYKEWPHKQN